MNDIKGIIEDVEKSSLVSNKVIKKVIEIIGQEKWQDINDEEDDICTTAGELSITLRGIEELEKGNKVLAQNLEDTEILNKTYEKRFSDLEKENAELHNNGFTVSAMTEQQLKVALEKGEQLEKENAELKTDYEVLSCSVGDFDELQDKLEEEQRKNNGLSDNLTTAEEIISEYVRLANLEKEDTVAIWQLYHKAEQFLKDYEVKSDKDDD